MFRRNKSKTAEYLAYQNEMRDYAFLDSPEWPFGTDQVEFVVEAGLSSKLADLDNVLKPLFDTYQSIYEEFNDKTVYKITATKVLVPRGDEFISVEVRPFAEEASEEQQEESKSKS